MEIRLNMLQEKIQMQALNETTKPTSLGSRWKSARTDKSIRSYGKEVTSTQKKKAAENMTYFSSSTSSLKFSQKQPLPSTLASTSTIPTPTIGAPPTTSIVEPTVSISPRSTTESYKNKG